MKKFYSLILLFACTVCTAQPPCNWAYIPVGNSSYHTIYNVTTDSHDNIIQTGKMLGVADMDPGTGPGDTAFTSAGYNYYISKTDISGHLLWIKYFWIQGSITSFEFRDLGVNSKDEIVVLGSYFGLVDFDLSPTGVDTLRSHFATYPDYFVATYDTSGDLKWAFSIGDPTTANINAQAMVIQPNDDIWVCANPNGTIDVDPGVNVHNSIAANANIICYDSNGNYIWNNNIGVTYSYAINNRSIAGDALGNNYVLSVGYYELTVTKFDNSGTRLWEKTLGDFLSLSRVNPLSVLVDKSTGDFYVAGTFGDTVDFDPQPATVNLINTSINYQDGFIAKYDSSMNLLWVNGYMGNITFGDYSLDWSGNDIVAVGNLAGTVDFGSGIILSTIATFSPFYLKIDNNGFAQDGFILNGIGNYKTINAAANGSFATSGSIANNTDMDPTSLGTLILTATTSTDFDAVYGASTTSIKVVGRDKDMMIYPNPSDGKITILFPQLVNNGTIEIYSILGVKEYSRSSTNQTKQEIKLDHFSPGIYVIKVRDGATEMISTFILK